VGCGLRVRAAFWSFVFPRLGSLNQIRQPLWAEREQFLREFLAFYAGNAVVGRTNSRLATSPFERDQLVVLQLI
jgi:hypothetical protein